MKLILEQRYLFDGSVGAIGHHATHADAHDPFHPDNHAAAITSSEVPGAAARAVTAEPVTAAPSGVTTVLIVDPRVTNWQSLVAGAKPSVDVVVLDPAKDGVTQVTQALQGLSGVKNLEFLTDGAPGTLSLGSTSLDMATLTARASDITGWSAHLSAQADIVFWGCNVGEGSAGATFVADMHTLTGATIGASSDATGSADLGGNWTLEVTTGDLHRDVVPFSAASVAGYSGILDNPLPTVTLVTSDGTSSHVATGTVLLGDTINVSMSFSNAAANATGFGPYVELFAPTALNLSNISSGGATLASRAVAVVGGTYINPLTGLSESAPTGITSGTAYFLALPYGSFTPGEPAVGITAQFNLSNALTTAQLTGLVGTSLAIEARGGFQYGAIATGGTAILEATPASSPETVELIESWVTVATMPGEGETATGPDFPVTYTVHLEPAPAVSTSLIPITNLVTTITLPSDIIASGSAVASAGGSDAGTASITPASGAGGTIQTLSIDYTRLSSTETVTFSAYVPEFYQYTSGGNAAGTPILDPATGAPVAVAISPAYTFSADPWNTLAVSGSGDVSGATFEAKSLAVQLLGTSGALPTQDVGYTLNFQVSDYFAVSGLKLSATLGNGLEFDPSTLHTPTLTVTAGSHGGVSGAGLTFDIAAGSETLTTANSETVNSAGSGTNISYLFTGATGTTAVLFDVGGLLPGTYGAGTVGSVTFAATVLDAYPTATDQVAGASGFLREGDAVVTTGAGNAASLYDFLGGTAYSAAVGSISDTTATAVDSLPEGSLSLSVVAVTDGGVTYTSGSHLSTIAPGDVVVYQLVYTLAQPGDFAGLSMTAYVPEPVFSVLTPTTPNTGDYTTTATSTTAFTASGATAANLTSGSYNFTTSYAGTPGIEVSSATASEPSNSVTFKVAATAPGSPVYLNTTTGPGAPQTVTIDFAVTASSLPFVDGLHLTAQGDSTYTPAQAPQIAFQKTQMLFLAEPLLLNLQQGVVSIVDDHGTDISTAPGIVWTAGATGAVTDSTAASAVFAAAGTPGTGVFVGTPAPATLNAALDNLNVAGAQAGDTVRIVDAVQNAGGYAAYDVIVKDSLSQAFTTASVAHLNFTRGDGTALVALDPATGTPLTNTQAIADFFSSSGVLLTVGGNHATAVLAASGATSDIVYVTYDVTLPAATPTAASLTGQATLVAWTNQDLYVASGTGYTLNMPGGVDGNFADAPAVGSSVATLTDTATIATVAPAITDTITGATDASDPGAAIPSNTFSTHNATIVPGETVSLMTTITLPQGVNGNVSAADVLPAGLIPVAGSIVATYYDASGQVIVQPSLSVSFTGNTLNLASANWIVPENAGSDRPATIVITYKALVPGNGSTIDASGWTNSNLAGHNTALTDSFAATSEGISYATTTETNVATTTGTGNASGIPNTITVTNPLVTATIAESVSGNVYSGETLTYTLTLTNSSATATAYDIGSTVTLPAGLTYVAASLTQTGGTTATVVDTGNVGVNGTAGAGNAIDGITLAPGATSTFTFQATVNDNLAAGTALTVAAKPAWESLPASATFDGAGNVNANAQAYAGGPGSVTNSVALLSPNLSIIGESNNTAGLGTSFNPTGETTGTAVGATDSEIVRMRAVVQIPEGQNNNVSMNVTLPNGLTYQSDASTTVLLISPNGDFTTSLTGTNLQAAGTTVDLTKLGLGHGSNDPVVTQLINGGGMASVSGQTVQFNLGTLANNDHVSSSNYVVVEFNAVVVDSTANGTALTTGMLANANGVATGAVNDYVNVAAPVVTLQKAVDGIVYNNNGTATVTYTDTEKNTGSAPAYNVVLDDPGAGPGTVVTYGGPVASGNITSVGPNGTHFDATLTALAAGGTQTFSYSVTIPSAQITTAVSDATATATLTSYALNPALEVSSGSPAALHETLLATSLLPPQHTATATVGLDLVSGTVNQDLSPVSGTDSPLLALPGQTVTVTFPGQTVGTEAITTDASGNYIVLVPDNTTSVSIAVTTAGSKAPPAVDALDNGTALAAVVPSGSVSGSDPATLTFTPAASHDYTGVVFDFWRPLDTAPVLANGPGSPFVTAAGTAIVPFAHATVSDAELDATFAHDYSGTTLTLQRYASGTATPDGSDVFSAAGTAAAGLYFSAGVSGAGNVVLAGTTVGTYTEAGGTLSIKFASTGVTATTVESVLNQINYTSTAGGNSALPAIVIGAQIDDANNNPIILSGATSDPAGPHDQGTGGDLLSNVLTASVTVNPIAPGLSIIGSSNDTAGLGTLFDPTGQTTGTAVTTTDSEIVRMRAVVQLPEGANSASDIVVTLPTGLTYQNDGSTNVLLVSPGGNVSAPSLTTTAGLQFAEGSTPADLTRLGLGSGPNDPVTTPLNEIGAISVSGQTVTFNFGTVNNPTTAAGPNYVVVEFNAVVVETTTATSTPLSAAMHADANGTPTATVNDYVSVIAPAVTLTKTIQNIAYNPDGTVTVSYLDTETNNGNAPAYDVRLTDPGAGTGTATYIGTSGPNTVTAAGPTGSEFDSVVTSLPGGGSQSFTFTVTIPAGQIATAVADATAQAVVTSTALNPAHEAGRPLLETLAGTSLTPPVHTVTATAGLDLVQGTVNQDVSPVSGTDNPLVGLPGQTVAVTFGGQTGSEITSTDGSGHYAVLVPDSGVPVTLTVTAAPPDAPTPDSLDNQAALIASVPGSAETGANPAVLAFTPTANTTYSPVVFDFWRPLDTAPVLANGPGAPLVVQNGTPIVPFADATASDVQLDGTFGHDFSGVTLTVQRYISGTAAPDATDVFSGAGTSTTGLFLSNGTSGAGNVILGGNTVGTYTEAGGVLTIKFAATGTPAITVDSVLNQITYTASPAGNPLVPGIVIGVQIDDANNDPISLHGNALDPTGPHDQGPGGDLLSNVLTATIDVHGTGPVSTFTEPNDSSPAAAAVSVDPLIDLTNVAHTAGIPSQVTLTIADSRPEDVLTFTNTTDIAGTYTNGTLTLTAVPGHVPTLAEWQAAIRSVQFYDSSDVPNTATRTIDFTLTSGGNTTTEQAGVAIVPVNDSPILNTEVAVSLTDSTEYQGTGTPVPAGPVGSLVSQLAGLSGTRPGNVTDPDGAGLTDGATPAAAGIAITGFNTTDPGGRSVGTWYFSINGGGTWTAFPTTISATQPLDLSSTARIAFQPTATDFNGQIPNAITFRAWDGFDGTANGTQAATLAGVTVFGQSASNNTAATAYSIATDVLPLMIDNVNNAPHATGDVTLPPVSTSEQHPPGQTVSQLFSGGFSDPQDSQLIPVANPLGSTSNPFAGIAVTANAATHNQGVWEYSLDGGNTWTAIPVNVSQFNAVILPLNAKLAFQPTDGFSGHPGELSVNLIDSSTTTVAPGLTGAQLAAEGTGGVPLAAATGVNIPAIGGSSAFSATPMTLGTLVNPLPPTLRSPAGEPAGPVFRGFPDDQQHDPTDAQFWTTDDYLGRPLIPDLSLVGSVANRFIIVEQHAVISVPPNIFQDSLPQAQLSYEAKLPDGSSLPSWITFNPNDLTFTGTPPRGAYGRLEILIRARDVAGNTADATFNLLIGREQQDLVGLLKPGRHPHRFLPLHAGNVAHGLQQATAAWVRAGQTPADHQRSMVERVSAQAALLADLPPAAPQAGGFSAALHAAGPMSALGRARVWLDNLGGMDRDRPAA